MGKAKRKNSNYITKKTKIAEEAKARKLAKKKSAKLALIITAAILGVGLIVGAVFGIGYGFFGWGTPSQNFTATHHATIVVKDYGTIHLELYGEEAPITVENFVSLAEDGFYDGLTFHRIIEDFMAQGGGNEDAELTPIKGEFSDNGVDNGILHRRGVISMARTNVYDSATSQFFIVHKTSKNNSLALDGKYAAFGKVTEGMDVVDKMCELQPYDNDGSILDSQKPIIESITIHAVH